MTEPNAFTIPLSKPPTTTPIPLTTTDEQRLTTDVLRLKADYDLNNRRTDALTRILADALRQKREPLL